MISLIGLLTLALLSVSVAASWECRRWEAEARTAMHETWPECEWIDQ